MMNKRKKILLAVLYVSLIAGSIAMTSTKVDALSVDEIYSKAYAASANAVKLKTQKSINEARAAISLLHDANINWAVGEFSKQVDQVQQPFLVNIIAAIHKAQNYPTQVNINKAKASIDPDMPDIWKNSYSSAVDLIQQKLMQKALDAYNTAYDSKLQADKDAANKIIEDIKTVKDTSISDWASSLQEEVDEIQVTYSDDVSKDSDIVEFADYELEDLVRNEINKPEGDLHISDVKNIRSLYSSGNITRLDGIENLTNLVHLELSSDAITDFSPLENLKNLYHLEVNITNSENANQLKNLTMLTDLYVHNLSSSEDLEKLSSLANLQDFSVTDSNISDFSSLSKLKNISKLSLCNDSISDVSFLRNISSLKYLDLSENYIEDLGPISSLDLIQLDISRNKIKNINFIGNMKNLSDFRANYNFIEDISPINNCSQLGTFYIIDNYVKDISVLKNLQSLFSLNLTDNVISDISALENLNNLNSLYLEGNPIVDIFPVSSKKLNFTDDLSLTQIEQSGKTAHSIIGSIINNSMSDLEKEKAIYSYVINHIQYDYQNYGYGEAVRKNPADIYGALVDGYAVCDGYAHTMKVLGRLANLNIIYISGDSEGTGHAWNMINLGEHYYQLDATWDDHGQANPSNYEYFNVSDEYMASYGYRTWDRKVYPKTAD